MTWFAVCDHAAYKAKCRIRIRPTSQNFWSDRLHETWLCLTKQNADSESDPHLKTSDQTVCMRLGCVLQIKMQIQNQTHISKLLIRPSAWDLAVSYKAKCRFRIRPTSQNFWSDRLHETWLCLTNQNADSESDPHLKTSDQTVCMRLGCVLQSKMQIQNQTHISKLLIRPSAWDLAVSYKAKCRFRIRPTSQNFWSDRLHETWLCLTKQNADSESDPHLKTSDQTVCMRLGCVFLPSQPTVLNAVARQRNG